MVFGPKRNSLDWGAKVFSPIKKPEKLTSALENHLSRCHENVENVCGPLWYKQYYTWTSRSKSQFTNDRIKRILEKYPPSTPSILTPDQGLVHPMFTNTPNLFDQLFEKIG